MKRTKTHRLIKEVRQRCLGGMGGELRNIVKLVKRRLKIVIDGVRESSTILDEFRQFQTKADRAVTEGRFLQVLGIFKKWCS